jgi:hypothetical protein
MYAYFWGKEAVYSDAQSATLHSSAKNPDGLSWVVLFNGANSKWNSDGVIFVKSNLNLLSAIHSFEVTAGPATAVDARSNDEAGEEGGVKLPADIEAASNGEEDHEAPNAPTGHAEAFDEAIPNPPKEGTPVHHAPIAIFSQPIRQASRSYKYIGW